MKNCPATAELTQSRRRGVLFSCGSGEDNAGTERGGGYFCPLLGELAERSHLLEITVSNTLGTRLEGGRFPGGLLGGNFLQIEANREN